MNLCNHPTTASEVLFSSAAVQASCAIVATASPPDVRKRLRPSVKGAFSEWGSAPGHSPKKNKKSANGGA